MRAAGGSRAALTTLMLPPTAEVIAASPFWVLHPLGVEQKRADALCRPAAIADQLEACPTPAPLTQRMTALRGVGPWTASEASRAAFGDPDAVSVGDLHVPHTVAPLRPPPEDPDLRPVLTVSAR